MINQKMGIPSGTYTLILMMIGFYVVDGIYIPAMPQVADYFHASGEAVRASMTFLQLGALFSCVAAGFFADFLGKKNFILAGLFIAAIGSVVCCFSGSLNFLLFGRFLQGVGSVIGLTMGYTLSADLYKPHETLRIIALSGVMIALVSIFIPYFGGITTAIWDWRATFFFSTLFFIVVFMNSAIKIPAKANDGKTKFNLKHNFMQYITIASDKTYLIYVTITGLFVGVYIFSVSFLPFFYQQVLNLNEEYIGLMIGVCIWLPYGLGNIFSIRIYDRYGINKTIYIGLGISFLASIIMFFTAIFFKDQIILNIMSMFLYFCGFGLMSSGIISRAMNIHMNHTTKASSLRIMLTSFFSFIGGLLAQKANDKMLIHLAIALFATVLLSGILFISMHKNSESHS